MTGATEDTLAATSAAGVEATPALVREAGGELERGVLVGRYVVISRLGAGGMGVVYAAYDPELDRKVALKLLHAERDGSSPASDGHARLLREAQAMAKLSHPNVIAVHDVGVHESRVYVAMEFVDGCTLGEWAKTPRGWREVLDVFTRAGIGIAAAHDKGLVHRDFKPDNVMVGNDGRVRVMDFGLARAAGMVEAVAVTEDTRIAPASDALARELTRVGSVLGTPAYMAPEQHLGISAGPAADQFSFCVSLWEALYGQRPFAGETLGALALAVTQGKLRDPPFGARVPRSLRRALMRGLAADPEQRFASMPDLLAALSHAKARARTRRLFTGVAVVAVLGAGVEGWRRHTVARDVADCESQGAEIAQIWNDETRAQVRAALLATEAGYAATTVEKTLPYLDAQASAWAQATTQGCLDARVHEHWDAKLLDRSRWCLDERRLELASLVQQLLEADAGVVQKAVTAAAGLARIEPCRDAVRLRLAPAPPQEREPVQAVRQALARVGAAAAAGKYEPALALAQQALDDAQHTDWPPLVAAARLHRGLLLGRLGRYAEAEQDQETAYFEAARAGAQELAAEAAVYLISTVGHKQARYADGERWAAHADVLLVALGEESSGLRRAAVLNNLGNIRWISGEHAKATELHRRALEIREQTLGSEHPEVGTSWHNLGTVQQSMGEHEAAKGLYERARAIREQTLGPDHPDLAATIHNLAHVHASTGDAEEAMRLYQRALSILEAALGPEHPDVAASLQQIAGVHYEQGSFAQAKPLIERALHIVEKALGPDHPDVAASRGNLAVILDSLGDTAGAEALHRQALASNEKTLGPDHADVAMSLGNLGIVALNRSDPAQAVALLERAVRIYEAHEGEQDGEMVAKFDLARALVLVDGDHARAISLARSARDTWREQGEVAAKPLAEAERWLAQQGADP